MTSEHAQWLNAELDHFHRATPDERAVILRDVQALSKHTDQETADWNTALLAYLQSQNLPVSAEPKRQMPEPITWSETAQVTLTIAKFLTPPVAICGTGYLLVTAIMAGAAGLKIWLLANGGIVAALIGGVGALWAASGLFPDKQDKEAEREEKDAYGANVAGSGGGKTIIQQFFIKGDGNTVVNNGEIK